MKQNQKISILCLSVLFSLLIFSTGCQKDSEDNNLVETCSDGIQNQDETGVDCGGVCSACPTCNDGIQNQDETGVDCGGSCDPCFVFSEFMKADISGVPFEANLVAGVQDGTQISFQSDQSQERQLFFKVPIDVALDSFNIMTTAGFSAEYKELFHGEYINQSGHIVITYHDQEKQELGGRFEFFAVESEFGTPVDTAIVTNGTFGVEYF